MGAGCCELVKPEVEGFITTNNTNEEFCMLSLWKWLSFAARLHLDEAVNLEREMGSGRSLGMALEKLGRLAFRMGNLAMAQAILE